MFLDKYRKSLILAIVTLLSSLIFWSFFTFNLPGIIGFPDVSLKTIEANYDGPYYLIISKCWYNKTCIGNHFSLPTPLEYYPAHLPGYPALISYFNNFIPGPQAMLLVTLLGSIFLSLAAFEFFKLFTKEKSAFWLTVLLLFFPARLFILRQIGAPETWFLALILTSIIYFKNNKYFLAALMAALAQLFKSPAILLFAAYGILALFEFSKKKSVIGLVKNYIWFLLVPATALLIFYLYKLQTGDFLAYFHSGDNIHLNLLPYTVFISNKSWIGSIWLEDIIYIFLLAFIGLRKLFGKYKLDIVFIFPLIYIVASLFVAHRDISRYIAPVYPFIFLAFQRFLTKKSSKIIFLILLPAIILYAVNFIIGNTAPVADWAPYL